MNQENRIVHYDHDIKIEALHFKGIMQKFPNHFHEYYVIGLVNSGRRFLTCKNKEYIINSGDMVLFNPLDNHACEQVDDNALDWRCLNLKKAVMHRMAEEITGKPDLPVFTSTVIRQSDIAPVLKDLHSMILNKSSDFNKEENFYFLIEQLITDYTNPAETALHPIDPQIEAACRYIEDNYTETLNLNGISKAAGLNKYILLRSFTRQRGITPYQYLSTIRVNTAKRLLEAGTPLADTAAQTGFTDQSHFTRFFKNFIGITPKLYQNIFTLDHQKENQKETS